MQKIRIGTDIKYDNHRFLDFEYDKLTNFELIPLFRLLKKFFYDLRYILGAFVVLFILSIPFFNLFYDKFLFDFTPYIKYVNDCKKSIIYERNNRFTKEQPFISICMSAYNMQEYIEKNLISIINQSFQNFEIIIVNDASEDKTQNIIKLFKSIDPRIKLFSHKTRLGEYRSRMEAIFNSKGEYIILMDPNDMYLNENLFQHLYNYNLKNNLDIIEFSVLQQIEQIDGKNIIIWPQNHFENHFHQFDKNIIYQPELSDLLYFSPGTKEHNKTICRNIWNKMIRIELFIKSNDYIGKKYYNDFIITGDDILMNIVIYQFAKNYSNINIPGYLNIRDNLNMPRDKGDEFKKIETKNFLSYFKLFYKYIKDYNKDINILFYEMKSLEEKIIIAKDNKMTKLKKVLLRLINIIQKENNLSKEFESYLQNLLSYLKN